MSAEPSLHLFYPENDLALARDIERYTAPPAAVRLRNAGETLPLWYGADGDRFVASGVNAAWLDGMKDRFGIDIDVFDYRPECYRPAPWGWSKASRGIYSRLGFGAGNLPDDAALDRLRMLSHRRTAAAVARRLQAATGIGSPAVEVRSADALQELLRSEPRLLVKLPWSSSGRGMVAVDTSTFEAQRPMIEGMIRRQGSVMAERHYDKALDFAMLFRMAAGRCEAAGLSVFETAGLGIYTGNILASETRLRSLVCDKTGTAQFDAVAQALPAILEDVIGDSYDGPLGVDMLATADGELVPVVEINLRMTMGHLCARFYERYVADGATGHFTVTTDRPADTSTVRNTRLHSGTLPLNPPATSFTFTATIG